MRMIEAPHEAGAGRDVSLRSPLSRTIHGCRWTTCSRNGAMRAAPGRPDAGLQEEGTFRRRLSDALAVSSQVEQVDRRSRRNRIAVSREPGAGVGRGKPRPIRVSCADQTTMFR